MVLAKSPKDYGKYAQIILSCEHASNAIPPEWRKLFAHKRRLLASHRGWDPGALEIMRTLQRRFGCFATAGKASRLLVDLNRTPWNPGFFSEVTRGLADVKRIALMGEYIRYITPVRREVRRIRDKRNFAIHFSIHTFTPVLRGRKRAVDVGLLFDPARPLEVKFARQLAAELRRRRPSLRVRLNAPYRGTSNSFTSLLRGIADPVHVRYKFYSYGGIEIETNQAIVRRGGKTFQAYRKMLADAIATVFDGLEKEADSIVRRRSEKSVSAS